MKWLGRLCGCSNNPYASETSTTSNKKVGCMTNTDISSEKSSVLDFLTIPPKYDTSSTTESGDEEWNDENESYPILSCSEASLGEAQTSVTAAPAAIADRSCTNKERVMMDKNEAMSCYQPSESVATTASLDATATSRTAVSGLYQPRDCVPSLSASSVCHEHSVGGVAGTMSSTMSSTASVHKICQKNKKRLKLLFLDIDGVLCFSGHIISSVHLHRVLKIIKKTQCKIVLSTTWRLRSDLKQRIFEAFAQAMADETDGGDRKFEKTMGRKMDVYEHIIGQTPDFKHLRPRAFEIMAFIDAVKTFPDYDLQDWVAIDDSNLYAACTQEELKQQLRDHFVRCNTHVGLTEEIMETIIAKLNHDAGGCHLSQDRQ